MEKIRQQIHFYGRVQGVGFRYKTRHLADRLGITGWVSNEYDGSVLGEFQGTEEELERLVQGLCQDRYIIIERMERKRLSVDEEERGFRVIRE